MKQHDVSRRTLLKGDRISSRAVDADGNIQPAPEDPFLASKRTYRGSNGQITRRVLIP